MIKVEITPRVLKEAMVETGKDYFSLEGLKLILEIYKDMEWDGEIDIDGICGDFKEYGDSDCTLSLWSMIADTQRNKDWDGLDYRAWLKIYGREDTKESAREFIDHEVFDWLSQRTYVTTLENGNFLVQDY